MADTAFLALTSRALSGTAGDKWAADYLAAKPEEDCGPRTTEAITVDGAAGLLAAHCPDGYFEGLAWDRGRGYVFMLYRVADKALFREILGTVDLPDTN